MGSIVFKLLENINKYPDRVAIIDESTNIFGFRSSKQVKFGELYDDMISTAKWLKSKGVKKGDRILLFIPMSYDLYRVLMSIYSIGATAVFVDAWADRKRLEQALEITGANVFVGTLKAQMLRVLSPVIRKKIPTKIVYSDRLIKKEKFSIDEFKSPEVKSSDTALITFTTGSTGVPKAAKRTHEYLLKQHEVLSSHMRLRDEDVDFVTLPIFVLNNLALGITSVIADFNPAKPGKVNPKRLVEQIKRNGVTTAIGSTAIVEAIENECRAKNTTIEFDSLFVGGSPVYPNIASRLVETFSSSRVEVVYGSTEAEPIGGAEASLVAKSSTDQGLLLGSKVPQIEVAVLKPIDGPIDGPISDHISYGEVGEIVVTGDHVLKEYINSPENFKQNKIVDGDKIWHRTGDAGRIDSDGNIRLFGRVGTRIVQEGNVYYTLPLEERLLQIAGVTCGTIVEVDEGIKVVFEGDDSVEFSTVDNAVHEIYPSILNFEVIKLSRIPRDPRHESKIDYGALKLEL